MKKKIFKGLAIAFALVMLLSLFGCGGKKLTIRNESYWELQHCYISLSTDGSWGSDRFSTALPTNKNKAIPFDEEAGTYDIKFVDEDGDSWVFWSVDLAPGAKIEVASWGSMTVTIRGNVVSYSGSLN